MSAEEYGAILGRLDGLERQVRWRYVERLLTLALMSWLLTSGPATTSARDGWQSLRLRFTAVNLRAALRWTWAGLQDLATVRPAVDPQILAEDQREASQAIATATRPSFMAGQRRPSGSSHGRRSSLLHSSATGSVKPAASGVRNVVGGRSLFAAPNASTPPRFVPSVTPSRRLPDLESSIREAERSLAHASEGAPKVAEFGPALPSVVARAAKNFNRSVPAALPATQADVRFDIAVGVPVHSGGGGACAKQRRSACSRCCPTHDCPESFGLCPVSGRRPGRSY